MAKNTTKKSQHFIYTRDLRNDNQVKLTPVSASNPAVLTVEALKEKLLIGTEAVSVKLKEFQSVNQKLPHKLNSEGKMKTFHTENVSDF